MILLLCLTLLPLALSQDAPSCGQKRDQLPFSDYIVAGRDVEPGSWPWQVSLQYTNGERWGHTCGGVLITPDWVLTAAHCVHNRAEASNFRVVAGAHNVTSSTEAVQVLDLDLIVEHEKFSMNPLFGFPNDIALLRTATPVDLTEENVGVACVADESLGDFSDNADCWISGWGLTHWLDKNIPDILQEAHIQVPTNTACRAYYPLNLRKSHICAGDGKPNACRGDSGGPMSCKVGDSWYVTGVTSFGPGFCSIIPGVYTRISSFSDWIQDNMDANVRV